MKFDIYISVWDKDICLQRDKANSLVAVWNMFSYSKLADVAQTVTDTGGTPRTSQTLGSCNADAGNSNFGIVVGTSLVATTINDTNIGTSQIVHGTGAGQLVYGSHATIPPSIAGSSCSWSLSRTFRNSSGAAITINKVALYETSGGFYFMLDSSLITPYEIADGVIRTITYDYTTTV